MQRRLFILYSALVALAAAPVCQALAIGRPEAGLWQFTKSTERQGVVKQGSPRTHCLGSNEITKFLDRMARLTSGEGIGEGGGCKPLDTPKIENGLSLRLACVGKISIDTTMNYQVEDPRHYKAVFETTASIGQKSAKSKWTIEGERIGDCPK